MDLGGIGEFILLLVEAIQWILILISFTSLVISIREESTLGILVSGGALVILLLKVVF